MKKLFCMIALAAISFGSVFAYSNTHSVKALQQDTVKKKRMKRDKRDIGRKKDTTLIKQKR
jgi:hypothetical protein